jgi:pimeloyl-ACP methyl ester carboxylesterase
MATILLLHGALGTARQMAPLAAQFGDHHVLMPTFSGHGEHTGNALDFERFVQDIGAAIAHANGPVHILGYSMGGYAALLFAVRHPERIASVCTVATKCIWTPEGLDPSVLEQKVPQFARMLAADHGPGWKELVRATADLMRRLASEPLLTDDVLSGVECPALLCVGDRDSTAVPEDTLHTARKLRNAATWVMPWTRHPFEDVDLPGLAGKFRMLMNGRS